MCVFLQVLRGFSVVVCFFDVRNGDHASFLEGKRYEHRDQRLSSAREPHSAIIKNVTYSA